MSLRDDYREQCLTDEEIRSRNEELSVWLNRVEADVLTALYVGAPSREVAKDLTGYTTGQVEHAVHVLKAQGLITEEPDA